MKLPLLFFLLLVLSTTSYSQSIIIDDNGIVKCEGVAIGTTETISGDTYEVVNRELLIQRRDEGADLTLLCVSNVTNMSDLFSFLEYSEPFNQPIGNWDVSNVTNMNRMFFLATAFNQSIENWDVSNVTTMVAMLAETPFNQPLNDWDVSSVISMRSMFLATPFNQPIDSWDVSSTTDMFGMFAFTTFDQPIGNWDVGSVTTMERMFYNSQFNQPVEDWDVGNVINMDWMFLNSQFDQPIGAWNVGSVTTMSSMFRNSRFNQPIGNWDVSNVTNMVLMFSTSQFNKPIGNWDVSNVTIMNSMFRFSSFDQPINLWCVSEIPDEPNNFSDDSPLAEEHKPIWGTCPNALTEPTLLSPENGSTVPELSINLSWDTIGDSDLFNIQISADEFSTLISDEVVAETSFSTPALNASTEYQWRVRATNDSNDVSYWSETWTFVTETGTSNSIDETPTQFALNQNYPNPFNPTTLIEFSMPESGNVRLEVYTLTGQLVQTLVNGTMNAGSHSVRFDGNSLSSGVYLYRLSTSDYTESRLMHLVK